MNSVNKDNLISVVSMDKVEVYKVPDGVKEEYKKYKKLINPVNWGKVIDDDAFNKFRDTLPPDINREIKVLKVVEMKVENVERVEELGKLSMGESYEVMNETPHELPSVDAMVIGDGVNLDERVPFSKKRSWLSRAWRRFLGVNHK